MSDNEIRLVNLALEFATAAHAGQSRVSGEPFIEHPLTVAQTLSDLQLDGLTLTVALLHDVVEDTPTTLREIYDHFGPEVARLVDGVTKVASCALDCADPAHIEAWHAANLDKLARAIKVDPRIAFIRLADRLHNLRTLNALPQAKQRQIAWETLIVFVPLAHCFGLMGIRDELQWRALAHLYVPWQKFSASLPSVTLGTIRPIRYAGKPLPLSRLMAWFNYITLWNLVSKPCFKGYRITTCRCCRLLLTQEH